MSPAINDVPAVELHIHQRADLRFQVGWFAEPTDEDPVPLEGAFGAVKDDTTEATVLLDLGAYTTIVDDQAVVNVPGSVTADIDPFQRGVWDFTLISSAGERKRVGRGPAFCHAGVGEEA